MAKKKMIRHTLSIWLLVGMAMSVGAQIKLFVIAGQSNADGKGRNEELVSPYDQPQTNVLIWFDEAATNWVDLAPGFSYSSSSLHGLELSLGKKAYETWGGDIRLIKFARSATAIANWMPGKTLYNSLVDVVSAATNSLAGQAYTLEALLWMQGESDSKELVTANAYQANLTEMIAGLRSQFSAPNMRVVIGRIREDLPEDPYLYHDIVRTGQVAFATGDADSDWVSTDDLGLSIDGVHYTSQGYIDLGNSMADSYRDMKEIPVSSREVDVLEGGTNSFDVRLEIEPATTVTVTVERVSGDTSIQIGSGAALVFTTNNWDVWQTVTFSAAADSDSENGRAVLHCVLSNLQTVVTVTEQDSAYLLPWRETFENVAGMAGQPGALNHQHGWNVSGSGTALVQNAVAKNGTQALSVTDARVSHGFLDNPTNIWITFWAKPQPEEGFSDRIYSDASAVFYVNTNNLLVAYDSTNATEMAEVPVSNVWNKFEIHCDYVSKVWNLELNDELVVSNFNFYGNPTDFRSFNITAKSNDVVYVDEIEIADTPSESEPDADGDGLPDWWENTYYGGDTNANPNATASNGVNSVLDAYIAGLDPTDPDSKFLISDFQPLTSVIQWNSASGRVYSIYWTSNLLSGFGGPLQTNLPWTPAIFTDSTHSAENQGFYKIEVKLSE